MRACAAQELHALSGYSGDRSALSGAEQFMLATTAVPRFAAKLQAVVFAQQVQRARVRGGGGPIAAAAVASAAAAAARGPAWSAFT